VEFEQIIRKSINDLSKDIELNAVTATSLFVAEVIKTLFPEIEVRASVNMGIGTIAGMSYVSNYFDSFYVKRELNRHPGKIRELRRWCRDHGKKLYLLVNSGCLRECSAHTFHDNLVAHEHELHLRENRWRGFNGVCWPYYSNPKNHYSFLRDSTWIRPEEICRYSGLVDGVKLATRSHRDPAMVIESYITGNFDGNTLALCEPDFSSLCFLDNKRFPEEWPFVLENMNETEQEEYCEELLNNVKV
jgi:collagenase-like PrtC family protease